jgi:tetratricopeptide (TPR) repeat protein
MTPVTFTQVQMLNQAKMARQLRDHGQAPLLMTEKELTREIKSARAEAVIKEVKGRGVDFDMTPGIEKKLRKANASDEVIEAARQAGPKVRAQMAKMIFGPSPTGVQDIPRDQARSFSAITGELDPDKEIALVDDFAKKYPHSLLLSSVYSFGANAYQQKGDVEKVVDYTGKSLKLKPDNLTSLILRLGMLPMPQYLRNHAADRDKILREALNDANRALQIIPQVPKLPNEADAAYQKRLAEIASEVHGPLGTVYLELATGAPGGPDKTVLAKAEQEFTTAVTTSSHPDPRDYYRMGEAYGLDGKWDEAIQAFKQVGGLGQGTLIKTYADEQIAQLKKRKAKESVASNPSAVSLK